MTTKFAAAGTAIRAGSRAALQHPGPVAVLAAAIWLGVPMVPGEIWFAAGTATLVLAVIASRFPRHAEALSTRLRCRLRRWWIRRHWIELMNSCGLAQHPTPLCVVVPKVRSAKASWPRVLIIVRPLMGQTLADFEDAGERLRVATAATDLRVQSHGVNEIALTFTIGDGLTLPATFSRPEQLRAGVDRVLMGRHEDGQPWYLPVGPHTLVAGCSGSGKGSLFWSFAFGLAPAVKAGQVQLHGIDLKGGMEILMGDQIFTQHATTAAEAVVVLERLVGQMRERTRRYAGLVRSHALTVEEPLHVVMIDELAALTAYCPERDLQRRAELAINLLCSQGRAPGFMVFACLQDPRKEVIPSRGLFTQMIGLRLKDMSETAMVLGELALASGAHCHRITRGTPGMGYVVPEDGGHPVRVRAAFVPDEVIRRLAQEFATPTRVQVVVPPAPVDEVRRLRSRSGA
jgi:S-DNA-T family DNA segregation ATPase FtsK/SpoIIIE